MKGVKVKLITKPNPNLFGGGIEKYTEENPYVLRTKDKDGFDVLTQHPVSMKNGHTYTLQLKSDGILSNSRPDVYNTHKDFVALIVNSQQSRYVTMYLLSQTMALGNGGHVITFIWPHEDTVAYLRVGTFSDGVIENVIKFWDMKIEEGRIPTDIER